MSAKHTLTPVPVRIALEYARKDGMIPVHDANNAMIGAFFFHDDAKEYVRIVNSHEALLEAVKLAYGLLVNLLTDNQLDFPQSGGWTARRRLKSIRRAIKQAK